MMMSRAPSSAAVVPQVSCLSALPIGNEVEIKYGSDYVEGSFVLASRTGTTTGVYGDGDVPLIMMKSPCYNDDDDDDVWGVCGGYTQRPRSMRKIRHGRWDCLWLRCAVTVMMMMMMMMMKRRREG